ncbi:unnamed protein product [Diamesa serratosioi]
MKLLIVILLITLYESTTGLGNEESKKSYWNDKANSLLREKRNIMLQKTLIAKNIIIFVGSGMSQATVTAARKLKGGENETFSFEQFPWSGSAKTYCVDTQVPDSACAATAFLTGVKSNMGTLGVSPSVSRGNCAVLTEENKLESIAKWALNAGKVIGFATNSRVTTGSAAALYANSANKNWESDKDVLKAGCGTDVKDIAYQLINSEVGKQFKVVLGGGRKNFLPSNINDMNGQPGTRTDNINLIEQWKSSKKDSRATFVTTKEELTTLNTTNIDYLFGLFDYDKLPYHLDVVNKTMNNIPMLIQMTHFSLGMLQKKEHKNGFLLFVEDGLINEAHKENKISKALTQVQEYSNALNMAKRMVEPTNTLVISLADVGSTLSIAGNAVRDTTNNIIQEAGEGTDGKPVLSLSYATGPSFDWFYRHDALSSSPRYNPMHKTDANHLPERDELVISAAVPMTEGVNGGEDVTVFATGPWSYLFSGNYEQNFIAHAIGYAACLEDFCNGSETLIASSFLMIAIVLNVFLKYFY